MILFIKINRNMRCIEIPVWFLLHPRYRPINRNMRCIEISTAYLLSYTRITINRNMRCIEMLLAQGNEELNEDKP